MGEIIRREAAAGDILEDAKTTLTNATVRGGVWQSAAEARLSPLLALAAGVQARREAAQTAFRPAQALLGITDDASDRLISRISDDTWNLVGRPAHDAAFDLLFPGGVSYYTEGETRDQPERMELLAELLESGIHPRLPAENARAFAAELRASGAALREKDDAARPFAARIALADKMEIAIARTAHASLVALKRIWKAEGHTDPEIHEVIPDRPRPVKKAPAA
jgi:hypothetical protein